MRGLLAVTAVVAAALFAIALLALAGAAHAAEEAKGYGELTRFGEMGDGAGQLDELRTRAIGVDPTDNSVYVVDEPKAPKELPNETEPKELERDIRLQKFTLQAGKYALSASAEFKENSPFFEKVAYEEGVSTEPLIQGVAVDPKGKHVYLLAVDIRESTLKQDSKEAKETGSFSTSASTLYAFSTQEEKGELIGAGKEGPKNEILTGPGVKGVGGLQAQSETPGASLLRPHGITVDPATGEVIVLAHIDPHKAKVDDLTKDHYVLQKVHSDGTVGERWVDSTDFLNGGFFRPHSPIVVETGGKEHLQLGYGGLVEIPSDFKSAPKRLSSGPTEGVVQGPTAGEGAAGARLSASPDGTVWGATGSVYNEVSPGTVEPHTGLMALSGVDGSQIGWTGGQAPVEPAKTLDRCVIEPNVFGQAWLVPRVAAGSEGKVFALAPEFLLRAEPEGEELEGGEILREALPPPFFPAIIEFGPGGGGCPQASATIPSAKVGGVEVNEARPGSLVSLSSHVKQADALKVVWEFSDGTKVETPTDQYQTTQITHKFDKEEEATITEKIYSDALSSPDQAVYKEGHLSTPTIVVARKLPVRLPPPHAGFSGPEAVKVGATATFESESSDPNGAGALPLKYVWSFGDGTPPTEPSTVTTASHAYPVAGTYTVTLTVTDKLGLKATASQTINVTESEPPPPPPPPPGGENPTANPGANPGTGGGTGGGGGGGVLSYQASLGSTSLSVAPSGAFAVTVRCLGQSSCTGAVTLRTLTAVSAAASASAKKKILVLGSATFSLAGGHSKSVTVRLSSKARRLLARTRVLRARATIVARDSAGAMHTTTPVVTLRQAKAKHH